MRAQRLSVLTQASRDLLCIVKQPWRTQWQCHLSASQRCESTQAHTRSPTLTAPPFAFAFDIDGVLLRSSAPLPGAIKTLRYLQSRNVPFILLTNGGGKTEQQRVEDLTQTLEVPLDTKNFIQSHTPFKELTIGQPGGGEGLKEKNVLIMGGEGGKCREVAESYGFKHAITPGDILVAHPGIWPFSRQWIDTYYKPFARPLPKPIITDPTISHSASQLSSLTPETNLQVSSIHVYNDPRDWGLDTTIILDLLLSHRGFLGTRSRLLGDTSLPNRGYQQDGQPTLWFSNPDLEWAASYHHPRLGQGGFREAFEGVWRAMTDPDNAGDVALKKTVIGKPFHDTYSYAEKILTTFRKELSESQGVDGSAELYRVYMIGDNPESDIRGANDYKSPQGTQWNSVLLRSGVYDEDAMGKPRYEPKIIMDDVWSGVQWALEKEGWCIDG